MLQKNEDLENIYDKENQKYTFFALGKPIKYKGVYFCRLQKQIRQLKEKNRIFRSHRCN
jgi:hypothetical protein